ncbi:MAG: YqhA family protein [Chlorobi bacterium]|nr:YqhA family protein [Chlorobiota bacterium]
MKPFKSLFKQFLVLSRFMVLIAVIVSLLASFMLFIAGLYEVTHVIWLLFKTGEMQIYQGKVLASVITALDMFLIATFLIIFSRGLYELFIGPLDAPTGKVFEIRSLEDLKTKLGKIIIMAMIVLLFKQLLKSHFTSALDFLYIGVALISISAALYLSHKETHEHEQKDGG